MIPVIGIMVGFYIITEMVRIFNDSPKETKGFTYMMAGLTIFVAILGMAYLILGPSMGAKILGQ